jgi:hypothetical protein
VGKTWDEGFDTGIITFGVRTIAVWQGDSQHPFAYVQASGIVQRDPRLRADNDIETVVKTDTGRQTAIPRVPAGMKWCSCCGDYVSETAFTSQANTFDGKHPYCNPCNADRHRRMYAARIAEVEGRDVRKYTRKAA